MTGGRDITAMDHVPEWGDPWGHARYYLGVTPKRVYAYLLDLVVVGLLCGLMFIASLILGILSFGLLWAPMMVMIGLVPVAYHTLTIAGPKSATWGMRAAGIKVMSVAPGAEASLGRPPLVQALIQTLGFYFSIALTCTLVLVVALFNPRRRTLHDMLAGTVVVNDPAQWGGPSA
ncbi:hypothetical protein A6A04_17120 [Paramagnetospirillum marisnigri]|uniref:RDD domain-containing protein n=1 Tax=Paramagnetospirillum marisnigri TaxID=1285242 RepID=A0A178MQC3_9PROT|nr:RDD family protein [Paramagnetospirillum marisnigri]OAN50821.1 hypothetical protein A6A04_17120 [Paramagnetospirillum marisnigri]